MVQYENDDEKMENDLGSEDNMNKGDEVAMAEEKPKKCRTTLNLFFNKVFFISFRPEMIEYASNKIQKSKLHFYTVDSQLFQTKANKTCIISW